ncbi:arylesterase [Maribacter hydrothermalis]|uniref:Arylesterase n=1 Tax=Maribacter hydrothermalis TaxID=1836467 RepID=A0A1B7Z274_9FLAO|nr:arylesterase [Maribacter hydrothermalis]APQ18303.1 arylesterase [Maribacter hydrothermalis]OBR36650.1 arylesterase [Maribacter hydrothermalis]
MLKVLKFRYFLLALVLIGCGENPEKKQTDGSINEENATQKVVLDTDKKVILFYGNSLTAAYGLDTKEGFPNKIQQRLDSLGLAYNVINSGLSGETTSGGLNRLDWVLNQPVDIFVLELGANDGLRGIPISETMNNLQRMIDMVKKKNPETLIILAGMQIPPNMGEDYTAQFKEMYPALAESNNILLIPFLLEGVAGIPSLNLEDGIHPTAEGQKIVANNVWEILKTIVLPLQKTEVNEEVSIEALN